MDQEGATPPEGSGGRYVYIWEFLVAPGREREFLAAYGPSGAWVRLFEQAAGYLETLLLRDRAVSGRFVTIDRWSSEDAHGAFLKRYRAEYAALDQVCEALTQHEASLGSYWEVTSSDNI